MEQFKHYIKGLIDKAKVYLTENKIVIGVSLLIGFIVGLSL